MAEYQPTTVAGRMAIDQAVTLRLQQTLMRDFAAKNADGAMSNHDREAYSAITTQLLRLFAVLGKAPEKPAGPSLAEFLAAKQPAAGP